MGTITLHKNNKLTQAVFFCLLSSIHLNAQRLKSIPFGHNPATGHYFQMDDHARIYYELYGSGKPVVLLHGGLFGDISEYEHLIPVLSKHFRVIAIETRGHGKSEVGNIPYTYSLMAQDAYHIVRHVSKDSAIVIGFSDGAVIAMALTIAHPELVKKLVFAGGNLKPDTGDLETLTGESIEKQYPDFVKERKALMPDPSKWGSFIALLKNAWLQPEYVDRSKLKDVRCPVLVAGGDHDQFNKLENFTGLYRSLPHAVLAIIPGSDHLVFQNRPDLMEALVIHFINE